MVRRRVTRRRTTRRRTYRPRRVYGRGAYTTRRRKAPARKRRRVATRRRSTAGKVLSGTKSVADYVGVPTLFGSFAKGFGSHIASTAGSLLGTALMAGDLLGYVPGPVGLVAKLGTSIARAVTGHGDYRVKSNSLMAAMTSNGPPRIVNSGSNGGFRISHREYLFDLGTGTGTPTVFTCQTLSLNPGQADTFPWLSTIAQNFEQYRIHGMLVEFKTLSVDAINSTNIQLGAVIIATDYNALHGPFSSKQVMENYEFCSSTKPSCSMIHPIECAAHQTPVENLYIRTGTVPQGSDARLYDLGTINIATQGLPAVATAIGEIWVSYDIEFFKPNVPQATNPDSSFPAVAHWSITGPGTPWNFSTGGPLGIQTGGNYPHINEQIPSEFAGPTMTGGTFNNGNVLSSTYQAGQIGLLYNFATGNYSQIYFMYGEQPHLYKLDIYLGATAAVANGAITLSTSPGNSLGFVSVFGCPYSQFPSNNATTPGPGTVNSIAAPAVSDTGTTHFQSYSTWVSVPGLGSPNVIAGSIVVADTWNATAASVDIVVSRVY